VRCVCSTGTRWEPLGNSAGNRNRKGDLFGWPLYECKALSRCVQPVQYQPGSCRGTARSGEMLGHTNRRPHQGSAHAQQPIRTVFPIIGWSHPILCRHVPLMARCSGTVCANPSALQNLRNHLLFSFIYELPLEWELISVSAVPFRTESLLRRCSPPWNTTT
jgi:hypothetical protein